MKKELLEIISNFERAVKEKNDRIEVFEDEVELTFENFIKWLRWDEDFVE